MPFKQAAEEVWYSHKVRMKEATLRGVTHRYGHLAEAIERAEAKRIEREAPEAQLKPERVLVSADGAFIHLTTGEWREVKTMVVGEVKQIWNAKEAQIETKSEKVSYFSRSYPIREFEQYALAELHRRGVFNAKEVVTVNDGAAWIESFADYHFPDAVRILDFRHARDYLVTIGKVVWPENSPELSQWLDRTTHQLRHEPPRQTLTDICLLETLVESEAQQAILDDARRYLQKREKMIDYSYFQARGYPLGSGSVESSHKLVVQSRMKQAGMRWASHHVDPMLALRNLVCNGRWLSGWSQIVATYWQHRHRQFRQQAQRQRPYSPPLPFASVKVAPSPPDLPPSKPPPSTKTSSRPASDHPWRLGLWPTSEAWRWN